MLIVGEGKRGRQPTLGQPSVPLGDRRLRLVPEVQAAYDLAALPPPIRCFSGAAKQLGVMRRVADPLSAHADRVDVHPRLGNARVFELGDQPSHAPVLTPGEHLDRLLVIERLHRTA